MSSAVKFDVAIVGAGPAGYVAAIRGAQLGLNVCLVEKREALGGTCLNVGCIPSKAMLESSHRYHMAQHDLEKHGVDVSGVALNLGTMLGRKDKVVNQLTGGVALLMKKNKVTVKNAWATLRKDGAALELDTGEVVEAKHIMLATGSVPVELPFAKFDHKVVIDSTDALALDAVPEHMVVIGAGVIGLEMGSVWKRLGAKVTLVDVAERPVAIMDEELGNEALKIFKQQGLEFVLGAKVQAVEVKGGKATVTVALADGKTETLVADKVLVSVGRKPATAELGLAEAGVKLDAKGFVEVDGHYRSSVASVLAVGDCAPGPMLAHKGEEEGIAAMEMIAGQHGHVNYGAIPSVVYTHPEMAGVGMTESEAVAAGRTVKTGKFKFIANGRALAVDEGYGFVKAIADAATDELLGVHIIGHNASEMIAEAAVLLEFKASSEDLARCCHAHPTMSEAVKEAAMAVAGRAIHS